MIPLLYIFVLGTATGYAPWFINGEPPKVLVTHGMPFEQRLKVDLGVRNPNDYARQITGLDFRLEPNDKKFAQTLSNAEFTVPRLNDTIVSVKTTTST